MVWRSVQVCRPKESTSGGHSEEREEVEGVVAARCWREDVAAGLLVEKAVPFIMAAHSADEVQVRQLHFLSVILS